MASGLVRFRHEMCPRQLRSRRVTAPEPRTIVRHRSNAARRYPVAVAMLFLLASVPMLAAVLVGSASLDGRARPRTPFVAGPPGHQVIVPGDASDPDYARRPLDASPLPARNGFPPGKAPVRTGHNTPILPPPPAGGSVVGAPPAGSGDAAGPGSGPGSSRGGGRNGGPGGGGTGGDPGGGSPGGGNT